MNRDIAKEPLLRFPGFNDEWKKERLGNSVKEVSKRYKNTDTVMELLSLSIEDGVVPHNQTGLRDNSSKNKDNYKIVNKDNLVYNKMRMWQGSSDISNYKGIVSPAYVVCQLNENTNPIYFKYYLKRYRSIFLFWKYSQGLTKDKLSLPYSIFKDIKISLPSLEEQSKIGSFFKTLDYLIENQESYIDKLESEKKGLLQDIFSRNLRLLDDNGEKFEGEWKEVKLGDVSENFQPKTISSKDLVVNGKYSVFGANGYIGHYNKCNVYKETVLISCRGANSGSVNFVPENTWVTGNSMVIQVIESHVNKNYLYNYLKSQDLKYMITGTAQPQIVKRDIDNHKIFLPSLPEQKAIGLFFKKIDDKIEKEKELLYKYKEMKKGLLQDMFV